MSEDLIYTCDVCSKQGDDAVDVPELNELFGDNTPSVEHLCEPCYIELCELVQKWVAVNRYKR